LRRVRSHVAGDRVFVTAYAADRAADELGWDRADILEVVAGLEPEDFLRVEGSRVRPGERIWVFCPLLDDQGAGLWIRLVERGGVVVVSFHRE